MPVSSERFSHIYYETELAHDPKAEAIFARFPNAVLIPVRRYTDVFNRPKQNYRVQRNGQALILARKYGQFLYPGAPVCHDFGSERFFYTADAINCVYDCEYCWLKGMYASAHMVLFLNTEDYFRSVEEHLKDGPMYLSLSFESDLVAVDSIFDHLEAWNRFVLFHPGLTAEVRTKCGSTSVLKHLEANERMIFAYSLSPESVISALEHGTSSLSSRLKAARTAAEKGFPIRICFDPMIAVKDWRKEYGAMMDTFLELLSPDLVRDFSIGTYRQSDVYQRRMKKRFPDSAILQYPYETIDGYARYPKDLRREMEAFLYERLRHYVDAKRIFLLEDNV